MDGKRDPDPGKRRGYHHGNLREALIKAALDLIAEKGPSGFTFAEAARAAGVSAAAPYRHFRDRDALIADVARRGFGELEAELSHAYVSGATSPLKAFQQVGRAYLAFARREPASFAAMFEAGLSFTDFPELKHAGDRAFDILRTSCDALASTVDRDARPPVMMMALHVWSLLHGIAALFGRGDGARRTIPMAPEDLLEAALLVYLRGLGLPHSLAEA